MDNLTPGGWAPVHDSGDGGNDWVNLRLAFGLEVVRDRSRYRIAAEFPHGVVVTDFIGVYSRSDADRALDELVHKLR